MNSFKTLFSTVTLVAMVGLAPTAQAADYVIDTQGAHASINFKVNHLGFSWVTGRFDTFAGTFSFDENNPAASSVAVTIDTASVNTNHAERDKHLRSGDFLDVSRFKQAKFVSKSVAVTGENTGIITGDLTLHGVTREVAIKGAYVGGGNDPWGGYRKGFSGTTSLRLADFGITFNLGPASEVVELSLHVEGVRQ